MEDDEKGKLFVGGLSWETTQENLSSYFLRFGEIIDCVVMKNNETGRSRGFGFVTFADVRNVIHVLQNGPHTLDGRTIDPKQCNPRAQQKPKRRTGFKVFLGGLPANITETDLRTFFSRYGKVTNIVIIYDQEKKKSRGFGFLSFEEEAAVQRVINDHYINLNGKKVEIKKAEQREENTPIVERFAVSAKEENCSSKVIDNLQSLDVQNSCSQFNLPSNLSQNYPGCGTSGSQLIHWGHYGCPQLSLSFSSYGMCNSPFPCCQPNGCQFWNTQPISMGLNKAADDNDVNTNALDAPLSIWSPNSPNASPPGDMQNNDPTNMVSMAGSVADYNGCPHYIRNNFEKDQSGFNFIGRDPSPSV